LFFLRSCILLLLLLLAAACRSACCNCLLMLLELLCYLGVGDASLEEVRNLVRKPASVFVSIFELSSKRELNRNSGQQVQRT